MDINNLSIDPHDLSRELADHAGVFGYVCGKYAEAQEKYDLMSHRLDSLYAALDAGIREEHRENSIKTTEKEIEGKVKINPTYRAACADLIKLKNKRDYLRSMKEAWKIKGDNIHRMAIMQRDEAIAIEKEKLPELGL